MIKLVSSLFLFMGVMVHGNENADALRPSLMEENGFIVKVSQTEAQVIEELLNTMGNSSLVSLLFKKSHLRSIAKKLRPVSSTQFLGYVFERPHLINQMKKIHGSSTRWDNLTRSIKRGLKKEAEANLFEDIPLFAKHTQSNKNILHHLAKEGRWDDFIVHILDRN